MWGPLFVLGAGFSRAVSSSMPLASELASRLNGMYFDGVRMEVPDLAPFANDIEQWFSYLAINQPWLSYEENLAKHVTYRRFVDVLHDTMVGAEHGYELSRGSEDEGHSWWLDALARRWASDSTATVITFNYDLLVERAVLSHMPDSSYIDLYDTSLEVLGHRRVEPMQFSSTNGLSMRLRLLKLHGSVNRGVRRSTDGGGDGGPIAITATRDTKGQQGFPYEWLRDSFARLRPLMVPPVASKDAFFLNDALAYQWCVASSSLGRCDEIVIIGYSFPPTDVMFRSMLSSRLARRGLDHLRLTVIDVSDEPVKRITPLLPDYVEVCTEFIAADGTGLERYVESLGERPASI